MPYVDRSLAETACAHRATGPRPPRWWRRRTGRALPSVTLTPVRVKFSLTPGNTLKVLRKRQLIELPRGDFGSFLRPSCRGPGRLTTCWRLGSHICSTALVPRLVQKGIQ
jgi:hypothetical protein